MIPKRIPIGKKSRNGFSGTVAHQDGLSFESGAKEPDNFVWGDFDSRVSMLYCTTMKPGEKCAGTTFLKIIFGLIKEGFELFGGNNFEFFPAGLNYFFLTKSDQNPDRGTFRATSHLSDVFP